MTRDEFWLIGNASYNKNKRYCQKLLDLAKYQAHLYIGFCIVTAFVTFFPKYLSDGRQIASNLPFQSYVLDFMPFKVQFFWEIIVAYQIVLSVLVMDIIVFTMLYLTAIQFKLLRLELEDVFNNTSMQGLYGSDMVIKRRLKMCNLHHIFLIR